MHAPLTEAYMLITSGRAWPAAAWYLTVLPASFTGLGLLARRLPGIGIVAPELAPAIGASVFVLLGGVLNLLRLAFPLAVWIILLTGLAAFCRAVWLRRTRSVGAGAGTLILGLMALSLAAFTAATQAAPSAYNWNDDLQSYFTHPVRMLETGTIYGSPLSSVGAVSLGGMAFVQCAALVCLPLSAVNGSDAVLGLVLCLIPIVGFGARNPRVWPVAALALLGLAAIDPFYVNISALYVGSALMIAAVLMSSASGRDGIFEGPSPVAVGILYAALVALKPTFLLFVGLHAGFVLAGSIFSSGKFRTPITRTVSSILLAAALLTPWILVHLHHYLSAAAAASHREIAHRAINLVDTTPLSNGFTGLGAYTLLVAATAVIAAVSMGFAPKPLKSAAVLAAVTSALALLAAYPAMLFLFPRLVGYGDSDPDAVRYFIPLAVGIFPAVLCTGSLSIAEGSSAMSARERMGLCLFLGLLALAGFGGSAALRLRNAARFHTLLPYTASHDPVLVGAMERALGPDKEAQISSLQNRIPEGASIVAWIYTPYFLDYSRNRVFDAELAGISNRWADTPKADYYLWEYRGSADLAARVQRIVDNLPAMDGFRIAPLRAFEKRLLDEHASGTVVFKDAEYVLVRSGARSPILGP